MASNPRRSNESSRSAPGSSHSQGNQHRPANPSGLRNAHMPPSSPEDRKDNGTQDRGQEQEQDQGSEIQPLLNDSPIRAEPADIYAEGATDEPEANARTRLLGEAQKYNVPAHEGCEEENCTHGGFSPRPRHHRGYGSFAPSIASTDGNMGSYTEGSYRGAGSGDSIHGVLGDALADSLMPQNGNKLSSTQYLAQRNKVKHSKMMYVGNFQQARFSLPFMPLRITQTNTKVGTCSTIFHAQTGSGNTAGHSYKAT